MRHQTDEQVSTSKPHANALADAAGEEGEE